MKRLPRAIILLASILFCSSITNNLAMAQSIQFPIDHDGFVLMQAVGNYLELIGTWNNPTAPDWEDLIKYTDGTCAIVTLVEHWDCGNPERHGTRSLYFYFKFEVQFPAKCEDPVCFWPLEHPDEYGQVCISSHYIKYATQVELRDGCDQPIRYRGMPSSDFVDLEEFVSQYAKLTCDTPSIDFPQTVTGHFYVGANETWVSILNMDSVFSKSAFYSANEYMTVCQYTNGQSGDLLYSVPYGNAVPYCVAPGEAQFSIESLEFLDTLSIYDLYGLNAVCYPNGESLKYNVHVKIDNGFEYWPPVCGGVAQPHDCRIESYNGETLICSNETSAMTPDEFDVPFTGSDYPICGFEEAYLHLNWKAKIGTYLHERDALPEETTLRIFHAFRADSIRNDPRYPSPPDTLMVEDSLYLLAFTYPFLRQNGRIEYRWHVVPSQRGEFKWTAGYGVPVLDNVFVPKQTGDCLIYYIVRDTIAGYEDTCPPRPVHIKAPQIYITSPLPDSNYVYNTQWIGSFNVISTGYTQPEIDNDSLLWNFSEIIGSRKTTIPSSAMGDSVIFNFDSLPSDNQQFGHKYVKAVLQKYENADSVPIEIFYSAWAANHEGGTPLTPNWYNYWSQALAVADSHVYDASLPDSIPGNTIIYANGESIIRIGRGAYWQPPGNPPTMNDYIDGFLATSRHEFWHRAHYLHNLNVHNAWVPPAVFNIDGDTLCDRDPNPGQPGQFLHGWEGLVGGNKFEIESNEIGAVWAETTGVYEKDTLDWAYPGSQWR